MHGYCQVMQVVQVVQAGGGPQGPSEHSSIWTKKCCTAGKQQASKHPVLLIFNGGDHGRDASGASASPPI